MLRTAIPAFCFHYAVLLLVRFTISYAIIYCNILFYISVLLYNLLSRLLSNLYKFSPAARLARGNKYKHKALDIFPSSGFMLMIYARHIPCPLLLKNYEIMTCFRAFPSQKLCSLPVLSLLGRTLQAGFPFKYLAEDQRLQICRQSHACQKQRPEFKYTDQGNTEENNQHEQ